MSASIPYLPIVETMPAVMAAAQVTLYDLLFRTARAGGDAIALWAGGCEHDYRSLLDAADAAARLLAENGVARGDRVAFYGPKQLWTLAGMLGCWRIGAIAVPINLQLKEDQVAYILGHSEAKLLLTTEERHKRLQSLRPDDRVIYGRDEMLAARGESGEEAGRHPIINQTDGDPAAILYTSGSTGMPKGVVLSHRNLVSGARSIAAYLGLDPSDRILGALPVSFDAGLNQFTTAIATGACYVALDFMFASEVAKVCAMAGVTSITAVPPLWMQISTAKWNPEAARSIRRIANTGGHMPRTLLGELRALFPNALPYLMYGLTEAFRSTYLPPAEIDRKIDSIGKAVPNAEVLIVRPDGSECDPHETGELIHRGSFVALGYWKDPQRTAEKFRTYWLMDGKIPRADTAVWSGDLAYKDEEGFLYFVGRNDNMLKVMGHRISPTEIEEAAYSTGMVSEAAAFGIPAGVKGHDIILCVKARQPESFNETAFSAQIEKKLPTFMKPAQIVAMGGLPRNQNGKIDLAGLTREFRERQSAEALQ